jgi:Flp pilus assembly protein TadG
MRYRDLLCRYKTDRIGSVAIIFALSLAILFSVCGLAIDASRAYSASTRIGAVLDAGALAGAKLLDNPSMTDADVRARTTAIVNAHTNALNMPGLSLNHLNIGIDRTASSVTVNVDVRVPAYFAQVAGVDQFSFNKMAEVVFVQKRVELAMVLDVTGSMNDSGKLAALKVAAKDVIDSLIDPGNPQAARVALVPYSAAVNVGPYATIASGGDSLDGCVMERLFPAARDTDAVSGGLRNFAVNGQLNSATSGRYFCPTAVINPLSTDMTTLKSTIDSYTAAGATAGHIGLNWGWNMISPNWSGVFTGASAPGPYGDSRYIKAIILLTDGLFNTSYTAGISDAEQTAEAAARTQALCAGIKAQGVTIYAVAVQAPPEAISLLRGCASSNANFYDTSDAGQLLASFRAIVADLQSISLKK